MRILNHFFITKPDFKVYLRRLEYIGNIMLPLIEVQLLMKLAVDFAAMNRP